MNSAQYTRVKELFARAADLSPEKRSAFLDREAAGDEELRRDVEALLRHVDEPTSTVPSAVLERSAAAMSHAHGRSASHLPLHPRKPDPMPQKIGPYRIVREIGRGGMGMVYLGVREDGRFKHRVAIKVIKKGMDSEDVLRRFELERQLLSALNHPNIARLYDGGTTEDGRPYFALEYIEGTHLDYYADRHKLTIEERLNVFKQVCAAVAHAHRNLVVHRDLKPANILVTEDGTVKLMDFGIAKLLNPELSLIAGDPTAKELRVMTPEYASPEQVRGETITTASDVYSLGVLLYELLTGHRPYRIKERVRAEIERVICEQEPERPSTAISKIEEVPDRTGISFGSLGPSGSPSMTTRTLTPESVSKTRGVKPETLRRRLAGDIDNIILMAMRKEPQRRYTSVERFAEDIDRHISGLPVAARPASFVYRSSKFVRRNKAGVAIAALIALSTAALIGVGYTSQAAAANLAKANEESALRESEQSRADAERARRAEAEALAEKRAALAERRAMSVRDLAKVFLFDFNHAIQQLEGATKARELLVTTALSYLRDIEADQDTGQDLLLLLELARAYDQVGDVQAGLRNPSLGDVPGAMESFNKALELRLRVVDQDAEYWNDRQFRIDLMNNHMRLGDVHRRAGLPPDEHYRRQYELAEQLLAEDPDDDDARLRWATALETMGGTYAQSGRHEEALEMYLKAHEHFDVLRQRHPGETNHVRNVAVQQVRIAWRSFTTCDFDEAMAWQGQALAWREQLSEAEPDNARLRRDLAFTRRMMGTYLLHGGDFDGAWEQFTANRDDLVHLAEADPHDARVHRDRAIAYGEIGSWHFRNGDANEAMQNSLQFHLHISNVASLDPNDAIVAAALSESHEHIARLVATEGDFAEAIRRYRDAIEITARLVGADPDRVSRREQLARQQAGLGRTFVMVNLLDDAEHALAEARAMYEGLIEQVPQNCHYRRGLAAVLGQQALLAARRGDAASCIKHADHGLELASSMPDAKATLLHAKALGLRLRGERDAAEDALRDALAILESKSRLDVEERDLLDTIRAELNR